MPPLNTPTQYHLGGKVMFRAETYRGTGGRPRITVTWTANEKVMTHLCTNLDRIFNGGIRDVGMRHENNQMIVDSPYDLTRALQHSIRACVPLPEGFRRAALRDLLTAAHGNRYAGQEPRFPFPG